MTRPSLVALALLLSACGPAAEGSTFPIELAVSRGLLDELSAFQVALVRQGSSLDCVAVQRACLKDQVDPARLVPLQDAQGREVRARSFPLSLVAGTPNVQNVTLEGLPLGKDFALVIEAVSSDATPRLAGSSCNYVKELVAGANGAVLARIEMRTPRVECDPRL